MSLKIYAYVHSEKPQFKYYCYKDSKSGNFVYKIIELDDKGKYKMEEEISKEQFESLGKVIVYSNF